MPPGLFLREFVNFVISSITNVGHALRARPHSWEPGSIPCLPPLLGERGSHLGSLKDAEMPEV